MLPNSFRVCSTLQFCRVVVFDVVLARKLVTSLNRCLLIVASAVVTSTSVQQSSWVFVVRVSVPHLKVSVCGCVVPTFFFILEHFVDVYRVVNALVRVCSRS